MSHVAVPVVSMVAVHSSYVLPLKVKVTGSSTIGVLVSGVVRTADTGVGDEKLPVTG